MEISIFETLVIVLITFIVCYAIAWIQKIYYDKTFYKKLRDSYKDKKKQSES